MLAATLSTVYGIYNGFELCEGTPIPGREEYLDSEKYEIKAWDYDRPGNIRDYVTRINQIRRDNPALQEFTNLRFYNAWNDQILYYGKMTATKDNIVLIAVNLDPHHGQAASFEVPLWELGLPDWAEVAVEDLLTGQRFTWHGKVQQVWLDPAGQPLRDLADRATRSAGLSSRAVSMRSSAMIDRSDPLWYKDAVIYQLHIKAFFDANNDGIGDFAGLMQKLDYVQELGVNTVWVLPFYPSPLRDDGYDIADYRNINPSYGTMRDFRRFVRAAHERGLRVITELVINHTSDQHPWFQRARQAKPGSAHRNYYVWSDTDQHYQETRIIFLDTEPSNWTWDPVAQQYFWHRFYHHQPDLNFDNPRVLREILRVLHFWLEMGIDGLRLDAIPYLVERDGTINENLPETHAVLKRIRAEIDRHFPGRMLLAEANQWPEDVLPYFGDGDECHMSFHFPVMPRMYMAIAQEDRHPIADILRQTPDIPPTCQWGVFLRNHDELTLEMVTDQERDYLWNFYAADRRVRLNLGIRRRLAPLLENDLRKIQLMNSLLLSMPGTPIVYYGDEIGMGDNIFLGDRDGVRTPMQWSPDRNGGFSRADPARLYLPPIMDAIYGYEAVNVEAQQRDPSSLLNWMKRMIAVRQAHQAFGRGTLRLLYPRNRKILAYLREHEGDRILCVANLARSAQAVELNLSEFRGFVPVELLGRSPFPPIGDLPYLLTLPGHGFFWFVLAEEAELPRWHEPIPEPLPDFITLVIREGGWRTLFDGLNVREFTREVLPEFLAKQRWFGAKDLAISAHPGRRLGRARRRARELPAGRARGRARRRERAAALLPAARRELRGAGADPRLAAALVLARPGPPRRQGRRLVRRDGRRRLPARRARRDPAQPRAAKLGRA